MLGDVRRRIGADARDRRDLLFSAAEEAPPERAGILLPAPLGRVLGVLPPAPRAAARAARVADRECAAAPIQVYRFRPHAVARPARLPVMRRRCFDPAVEQGHGILAVVIEPRQPDEMVDPRQLERDPLAVEAEN